MAGVKDAFARAAKSPLWALAPAVLCGALALMGAASHESVVFDPNAVETPQAPVVDLQTRDLPEEKGGAATLEVSMPEEALSGELRDGTYEGSALCGAGNDEDWKPYYIIVEIKVEGGRVVEVSDIRGDAAGDIDAAYAYDAAENGMYLDRAVEGTGGRFSKGALAQLQAMLDEGAATGGVDTVSGSTYSVVSIVQAYNRAVSQAVEQAK